MLTSDDDDCLPEMPLGIRRKYDNKQDQEDLNLANPKGVHSEMEVETVGGYLRESREK
jgi:hypothetical protein